MSKDLSFKLRLDAQDRERLDTVAGHYSVTAATAIRILIKEKYDGLDPVDRQIGKSDAGYRRAIEAAPYGALPTIRRGVGLAADRKMKDPIVVLLHKGEEAEIFAPDVARSGAVNVGTEGGYDVFVVDRTKWATGEDEDDGAILKARVRGAVTLVIHYDRHPHVIQLTSAQLANSAPAAKKSSATPKKTRQ